jgi:FtsP/CotA-like multicopper oxidase with cupredoxin domain
MTVLFQLLNAQRQRVKQRPTNGVLRRYGSSWCHSHIGLQAWEGVFGGIVINGPATANYDVDKGSLFLNDWSHRTVDELYDSAQSSGLPTLDNGLINGTNVCGDDKIRLARRDTDSTRLSLRVLRTSSV